MRFHPIFSAALACAALSACAPAEPRLQLPYPIDSFCGSRVARGTAINSIIASTDDRIENAPTPTLASLRATAATHQGAVGHWPAGQLLKLPNVAHQVGAAGDYVTIRTAAVVRSGGSGETRPVYVELNDRGTWRWVELRSFDKQDVCVEGSISL